MLRKSSLGEEEVPVIYPHSTSGSSACYMLTMGTSTNEWNDEEKLGGNTNVLMFYAGQDKHYSSSVFAVCLQHKQTRFNFPFFSTASYHSCTFVWNEMEISIAIFFSLSLYAVQDRHTEMSHLYYVSMYRLTTGFLHLLLYFIQINTAQSSAVWWEGPELKLQKPSTCQNDFN